MFVDVVATYVPYPSIGLDDNAQRQQNVSE